MAETKCVIPKAGRPQMPGYGIKGENEGKGLLPWTWAEERLQRARVYWLSTVRRGGAPHTMPLWAVWHNNILIFTTGVQSLKARNLAFNPRCAVGIAEGDEAVVVEGKAERVSDTILWGTFARKYQEKYDWDTTQMAPEPFYVVRPKKVFGLMPGLADSATRWEF